MFVCLLNVRPYVTPHGQHVEIFYDCQLTNQIRIVSNSDKGVVFWVGAEVYFGH